MTRRYNDIDRRVCFLIVVVFDCGLALGRGIAMPWFVVLVLIATEPIREAARKHIDKM